MYKMFKAALFVSVKNRIPYKYYLVRQIVVYSYHRILQSIKNGQKITGHKITAKS